MSEIRNPTKTRIVQTASSFWYQTFEPTKTYSFISELSWCVKFSNFHQHFDYIVKKKVKRSEVTEMTLH